MQTSCRIRHVLKLNQSGVPVKKEKEAAGHRYEIAPMWMR